jgi:hypothetical protein
MNRSTMFAALALSLAACATEDVTELALKDEIPEGAKVYELRPTELRPQLDKEGQPLPGTLELELSEGRLDITHLVPEKPREFESREQFREWLVKELNAQNVEGGLELDVKQLDAAFLLDPATGEYELREDAIGAIIGGREGYVLIKGERECVSRECFEKEERPTKERRFVLNSAYAISAPTGRMELIGGSWHSPPGSLTLWNATTSQLDSRGGVDRFVIGSGCPTSTGLCYVELGTNLVSVSYTARRIGLPIQSETLSMFNTIAVSMFRYRWDWPWNNTDNVCASHLVVDREVAFTTTGSVAGLPFNDCP